MQHPAPPRRLKPSGTLTGGLVEILSQRISDGHILPGDKLPTESAIMAEQGVSRTVVREAISRLQAAGLVETRRGIGTFVLKPPNASNFRLDHAVITTLLDVIDIMELRIALEVEGARLAAERRTSKQAAALKAALQNLQNLESKGEDCVAADIQFHLVIAQSIGNRYFVETLSHLGATMIPRSRINTAQMADIVKSDYQSMINREHFEIYSAIERQDAEAAGNAMRKHLINSNQRLRTFQKNQGHESS